MAVLEHFTALLGHFHGWMGYSYHAIARLCWACDSLDGDPGDRHLIV